MRRPLQTKQTQKTRYWKIRTFDSFEGSRAPSTFFQKPTYWILILVGLNVGMKHTLVSLLKAGAGQNFVNSSFLQPNLQLYVKPFPTLQLKTTTDQTALAQGLICLHIYMGHLHPCTKLGIVEIFCCTFYLGRHASICVFLPSSQPTERSCQYTPAWWQFSRLFRKSCRSWWRTRETTQFCLVREASDISMSHTEFYNSTTVHPTITYDSFSSCLAFVHRVPQSHAGEEPVNDHFADDEHLSRKNSRGLCSNGLGEANSFFQKCLRYKRM